MDIFKLLRGDDLGFAGEKGCSRQERVFAVQSANFPQVDWWFAGSVPVSRSRTGEPIETQSAAIVNAPERLLNPASCTPCSVLKSRYIINWI